MCRPRRAVGGGGREEYARAHARPPACRPHFGHQGNKIELDNDAPRRYLL